MPATLAAIAVVLAALGLQLVMVVGMIGPSLMLSLLGYAGLFGGMFMIVPAATRQARRNRAAGDERARRGQ